MAVLAVMVRAEAIAKEVEALAPGIPDRGLRFVEGEPELGHRPPRPRQRLGRMSAAENDEIVGVRDDLGLIGLSCLGAAPMLEEAVHV